MGLAVAPEINLKILSVEIEKAPVGIHLIQFPVLPLLSLTEALVLKLIFSFVFREHGGRIKNLGAEYYFNPDGE